MSGGKLVAQLNATWRVVLLGHEGASKRPVWNVEHLVDGQWQQRGYFRSREALLWMVPSFGNIDATAARTLISLPARVDQRPPNEPRPPRYKRKRQPKVAAPTVVEKPIANSKAFERKPAAPAVAHTAQRFVYWRRNQPPR